MPVISGYTPTRSTFANQNDGVVIYVRSEIKHTIIDPSFLDSTCLILRVSPDIAVVAVYRSPSFKDADRFISSLNNTLSTLSAQGTVVIMGDININIMPNNKDKNSEDYLSLTAFHGFLPVHHFTTHDDRCLDHVLLRTNRSSTTLVFDSYFTDHAPTLLCVDSGSLAEKPKSIFRQINLPAVISTLEDTDLTQIVSCTDPNQCACLLISTLSSIVAEHSTVQKVPHRKKIMKPWITSGLLRCIRNRDILHRKYDQDRSNMIAKITYTRYRNYCNNLLKNLKRNYEQNILHRARGNPKATWDVIKTLTYKNPEKTKSAALLALSDDPTSSVDIVNGYFANVGKNLAAKLQATEHPSGIRDYGFNNIVNPLGNSLGLLDTDCSEINAIISGLKTNCATGCDGIPVSVIKSARHILIPPIVHLCNLCLSKGIFPDSFKKALISPIYKGGDGDRVENYRPISVLTVLSKILEKVLNKRLVNFLQQNKVLAPNQFGFTKGKSTEDAALELTNHVVHNLDNRVKTIGIFLDLAKAFDTVSIPLLLNEMEKIGVRGIALDIFRDYLANRTQSVKIESYISGNENLTFGVPQGSVLGPTLFLIYINKLCQLSIPNCKILVYADDTALIVSADTWDVAYHRAEKALGTVMEWLACNSLTLNTEKTKYITFSANSATRPCIPDIRAHSCYAATGNACNCPTIQRASCVRYLGVYIDSTLNWQKQIDVTVSRVRKLIFPMKKLRNVADAPLLKTVYLALVQSLVTYCIPVWGGTFKSSLLRLERAQRAVLKVMLNKPYRYPTSQVYKDIPVLTVRQLCALHITLRMHSTLMYDPLVIASECRRRDRVCRNIRTNTALADRHYQSLSSWLYNKVDKICNIYSLPMSKCKHVIVQYLQCKSYEETEGLFARTTM